MTPGQLARAYRLTGYEADGVVVRLGRRPDAAARLLLRRLGTREAGFVTAWNPLSRRYPEGWNRRMQRALLAAVRGRPHLAGAGRGRGWAEAHLLVGVDRRAVLRLARRFRQRAVVMLERGGRPRLVWVTRLPAARVQRDAGGMWTASQSVSLSVSVPATQWRHKAGRIA